MNKSDQGEIVIHKKNGADMLRRFGMIYILSGMGLLLRRLRMQDRSADNIRQAAEQGPLVYVLYARSKIDWLALNRTLNMRRLPLAKFTWGLRSVWFRPIIDAFTQGWFALRQFFSGAVTDRDCLQASLIRSEPCVVFLVKTTSMGGEPLGVIKELAEIQEKLDRPIQLVPVTVVWNRRPETLRSDTMRFLLGAADEPGPLQKLFHVANRDHEPLIQAGAPVDLKEILSRYEKHPIDRKVRAVRLLLRRYLYRESHVIRGPRIRPPSWMHRLVMDSPEIRDLVLSQSAERGKSPAKVRKEVSKVLRHVSARFSFRMVRIVARICRFIFSRIYSGIDIRDEDLERLRSAIRAGSPVLVPSHRSHLDYLLISSLCFERGLVLPHIVAGENLSFWPMGSIFRRCGAFFIKRSFRTDKIFPVVFNRYLRQLIRDEYPIEFFIEGGRSRTGKLLPPRLGVLGIVMDAAAEVRQDRDVPLLPIAVSYEQIAEEKSYARELSGGTKDKESVKGVLSARKVLKKRFGKVYIRVGEPISLRNYLGGLEAPWSELSAERKKEALLEVGELLMYSIGKNMLILPTGITSMALLATGERGVRITDLQQRAKRFDVLLRMQGAYMVDSLSHGGWVVMEAVERFMREKWVQRITDETGDILQIHSEYRVTLEYYKNGLIHFVAPHSMLATAILANDGKCSDPETLRLFRSQLFLLRYEFPTDPRVAMEDLALRCREEMVKYRALKIDDDGNYSIDHKELLLELSGLTINFLESYLLTLRACHSFRSRNMNQKELPERVRDYGKARIAIDEVKRSEALSIVNLKNAIRAYREEGVIQLLADGGGIKFDQMAYDQYTEDLLHMIS